MSKDKQEQSIWNRDIFELLEESIIKLGQYVEKKEQVSLDEFINHHSKIIDDYILTAIHEEKVNYIGGTFEISLSKPDYHFSFFINLYFQYPESEDFIHKKMEKRGLPIEFYLNKEAMQELERVSSIKFDIEPPK